ncbi:TolC family outer membrane protein [Aquibium microcysteis]|uniref:TolC family outer membrane protein n=1 Tax=Aquibium microcysteis TaxID=675281 RepID=UPI003B848AAE
MASISKSLLAALLVTAALVSPGPASAETMLGALAKAYQNNSALNSARAGVRVTDENVAIAKSGYRPTIAATGSLQYTQTSGLTEASIRTGSFGVQINQTLFDGFQTKNNVLAAKSQVYAARESLRNTEQNTLYSAATAYLDVIRDRQIAVLRERNLEFLSEQVRAARSRFDVGEGTRTDVAQAEASRSAAVAQLSLARATAQASEATYRQIVGDAPGKLQPVSPLARLLPKSLGQAIELALVRHPAILATQHLVDAAGFSVNSAEGALLPGVTASAGLSRSFSDASPARPGSDGYSNSASIGATLTIPLYQGGRTSALVRQSKESLGQARIEVDVSRDQVRAAVTSAWTQFQAGAEVVAANRELVSAAQLALNGVIEERNVGQRTTLDVLDSQASVITAQVNLVSAEHDVVLASFAILSAIGSLGVESLGLNVATYRPEEHYEAVKDKWFGLRTPDGR